MNTLLDTWLALLGKVIAVVALAWGAFIWFGKKWVEQHFAKQVERLKHEQATQLQEQRFKIDALFNRITKIHEREVEVLPVLWQRLQDALGHIAAMTSPFTSSVDLDRLTADKLEEFLAASRLTEVDRQTVRHAEKKQNTYREIGFWYDLADAHDATNQYRDYLVRNSIFLTPDLKAMFKELAAFLHGALVDIRISKESKEHRFVRETAQALHGSVMATVTEIERLVQKRLRMGDA